MQAKTWVDCGHLKTRETQQEVIENARMISKTSIV